MSFAVRTGILFAASCVLAVIAFPHARDSAAILAARDDPADLSEAQLQTVIRQTPPQIEREIDTALAAGDVDLAQSFVTFARAHDVALSPQITTRVAAASADAQGTAHLARQFATGLVTGDVTDVASFTGTITGDLLVFGDIRDVIREGEHWVTGEKVDRLVLGLACVGLAITAATYASIGAAVPARAGMTMVKDARVAGRLSEGLGAWAGNAAGEIVDTPLLENALADASLSEPGPAIRAIQNSVRLDRAGQMIALAKDVGRVGEKAGTRAAVDVLKVAESPEDVARAARLAAAKGGQTRAIIKILGRSALVLAAGAVDLASWLFAALLALFGVVSTLKATTERLSLACFRHRRLRRQRALAIRA